jgi:AraC-like DNA-binding protein
MIDKGGDLPRGWSTWHYRGLPEYSPVEARLPVIENSVIQVAPGRFVAGATIVSNDEVTALHSLVSAPSIGIAVARPGYTGIFLPLDWDGDLRINGVKATRTAIHMPVEDDSMYICGGRRNQLGCLFPRERFVETVAALQGVDPDQVTLRDRSLDLSPEASSAARTRLASIITMGRRADAKSTSDSVPFDLTGLIFELMVDTYLHARPEPTVKSGRARKTARIVRAAEERFARAQGNPVSLADLCLAAGVSKSALYTAFQRWCGEPPIAYFHKRRLTNARISLLNSAPKRGGVQSAALGAGLSELGRFSREYRQLFGESPSVTLSRPEIIHSKTADK